MMPQGLYDPVRLNRLGIDLVRELRNAQSARAGLESKWTNYLRAYRAEPEYSVKSFPYEGCSNLVVPLIATDVDKTVAWIMSLLFQHDNLWVAKARSPEMVEIAPRIQEFMEWAQHHELNLYDEVADFVKETVLLGTGVLKTRYHRDVRKVYEYREAQTNSAQEEGQNFERMSMVSMSDRPSVEHVSLWDFYVDPSAPTMETASWVAQHVPMTWQQFQQRERMGVYYNSGKLRESWANSRGHEIDQYQQRQDSYVPYDGTKLELYEFWTDCDIDNDGLEEACVVTIHVPSGEIVRYDFNPYFNQRPPYDLAPFVRVPKRIYGIGLGEMEFYGQEEVTTMHNQRIDAVTVRNMPVFWAIKGGSVTQDTAIFPGTKLLVNSPNEVGVLPLAVGQFVSTASDEQMAMAIMRERVGISDFVTGGDGPDVSYATATTAINQLREGRKRLDQSVREFRKALGGVGTKVFELYQQFNQKGKQYTALGGPDGAIVTQVLNFPLDLIRANVIIDVAATSAAVNKEVEVRTNTLIMQLLGQHGQQQLQLVAQILNPQVPAPLKEAMFIQLQSASKLMKRVLDSYGVQDADEMIYDPQSLLGALSGNTGQQSIGGPAGPPSQPPGASGLPGLPAGADAGAQGGAGFSQPSY